ncbi:ribbon-helix-helix domain-containing protein [Bythopirellula polymerisocia]|uniref:Antitoxin ParD1 n=1 Tax=Bythopirellula polymerisocia TaxID=2528003 RepID=A0A5C6CCN6_9BACT|nr:type II toxin-antitoxin system ParD family antitoxin [Bythopirellula polymerisocia]TWU21968.1 hypothetical protein Pla144_44350 [Bythopirellula polymerisocia]
MEIQLPTDQQAIVEDMVASGRFSSVNEAISAGVRLLASTEALRQEVQLGIEQADRGEVIDHDTVFSRLRTVAASAQG